MTIYRSTSDRVALVTGGSSGLGRAIVHTLSAAGWAVITDARHAERLDDALRDTGALAIPGDVADPQHRAVLADLAGKLGGLDLLVLNASTLGPLPMRELTEHRPEDLAATIVANAVAPAALAIDLHRHLRARDGVVLAISSDAAIEHYPTWGPYAAGKAALDHLVLTLAAETGLTTYAVDPGDLRTPMHQDAFPGEDISDRPLPESVVPRLLALVTARPASGRYRAADLPSESAARVGVAAR